MQEMRIRTKGDSELLVKRRLGILAELIEEFGLTVSVAQVPTSVNKADCLTRVKKNMAIITW